MEPSISTIAIAECLSEYTPEELAFSEYGTFTCAIVELFCQRTLVGVVDSATPQ